VITLRGDDPGSGVFDEPEHATSTAITMTRNTRRSSHGPRRSPSPSWAVLTPGRYRP
jgi:hypothetical protein